MDSTANVIKPISLVDDEDPGIANEDNIAINEEYCLLDSNDDMHTTSTNVEDDSRDANDDVDEYALFDQLRGKKR